MRDPNLPIVSQEQGSIAATRLSEGELSPLEQDVLAVCGGLVRKLPYDAAQTAATVRLVSLGLVQFVMVDDQPTHVTTPAGDEVLRAQRSPSAVSEDVTPPISNSDQE